MVLHATAGDHRSLVLLQSHLSRHAYQPQSSSRSRVVILIKHGSELYQHRLTKDDIIIGYQKCRRPGDMETNIFHESVFVSHYRNTEGIYIQEEAFQLLSIKPAGYRYRWYL